MSYAAAIDQLSAMAPELHTQPGQQRRKFSLDEIGILLDALGNPHRRFRSVLIAGTNGKGSTASTLASILQASGLRTGLYTSPHLVRPNERIRLNGVEISDDAFAALYFRVHDCGQQLVLNRASSQDLAAGQSSSGGRSLAQLPSFFETLTAMAFVYFAEQAVDIAVLEVGMGGRLDATNIVDPLLSIVTDISLDHTEWLGPTIATIAREKAGILRANGTLITLPQHPEANQVLGEVATELGTRAVSAVPYMPAGPSAASGAAAQLAPSMHSSAYQIEVLGSTIAVDSPLHGDHQHRNIALAIAAAVELSTRHHLPLTPASIEQGIRTTQWPGRLEVITTRACAIEMGAPGLASETWEIGSGHKPAPVAPQRSVSGSNDPPLDRTHWVLDVAHNPAGAWALRAALRSEFALNPPEEKAATLIFGCLRDKPLAEMAQILFPLFEEIIFAPIHSPRATPMPDLLAAAETVGVPARAASSISEALSWGESSSVSSSGREAPVARPAITVVAGSVYLVGEIRPILLARTQSAQPAQVPQPIA
jgi:dihydrofolate synthase / folylpolyglutamate synthase